jgi:hypothetical protein
MKCGYCRRSGHNVRTCPRLGRGKGRLRKCSACGMPGHTKRTCQGRMHPCCSHPCQEYHSSWKDETGLCAHCGKHLRWGNGPLKYGAWPR